jgi:hypothetical protein
MEAATTTARSISSRRKARVGPADLPGERALANFLERASPGLFLCKQTALRCRFPRRLVRPGRDSRSLPSQYLPRRPWRGNRVRADSEGIHPTSRRQAGSTGDSAYGEAGAPDLVNLLLQRHLLDQRRNFFVGGIGGLGDELAG